MSTLDDAFQFSKNFASNTANGGMSLGKKVMNGVRAMGQPPTSPPTENIAGATTPAQTPIASPPAVSPNTPQSVPTPNAPTGVRAPDQVLGAPPAAQPFKFQPTTQGAATDVQARVLPPPPIAPPVAAAPLSTSTDLAVRAPTPGTGVGPAAYRPNFTTPAASAPIGAPTGSDLISRPNFTIPKTGPIPTAPPGGFGAPAVDAVPGAFVGPPEAGLGVRYGQLMKSASANINGAAGPGAGFIGKTFAKGGGVLAPVVGGVKGAIGANEDTKTLLANGDGTPLDTALTTGAVAGERVGRFASAMAGGGIGASLGSVVPVVGNALGGIAGSIAGYYAPDAVKSAADYVSDKLGFRLSDSKLSSDTAADLRAQGVGAPQAAPAPAVAAAAPAEAPAAAPAAPASNEEIGAKQFALSDQLARGGLSSNGSGSVVDRGSNGLRQIAGNPQAQASFNNLQTARNNGIRADVRNGQVVLSNDPNNPGQPAPTSGIDLNSANAISARANAIRASTPAENDPNALFSGAPSTGSTDLSLGGAIGRRVQRDQIQQRLAAQDFGLRSRVADQTALHNAQTNQIAQGQLQRENAKDSATLAESARKTNLEFGAGSVANRRLANEQDEHIDTMASQREKAISDELDRSLPPITDAKGNTVPNTQLRASVLSDLQSTMAARAKEARASGNTQLADHLDRAKLSAATDADLDRYKAYAEIKNIAEQSKGSFGYGSSTFVNSPDLRTYGLAKDQPNNIGPNQVKLQNGTVIPRALLERTNNPNVYFSAFNGQGSPQTTKYTNALGLRSN